MLAILAFYSTRLGLLAAVVSLVCSCGLVGYDGLAGSGIDGADGGTVVAGDTQVIRGQVLLDGLQETVAIPEVDLSKSLLLFNYRCNSASPGSAHVMGKLTAADAITFERADQQDTIAIEYRVVESDSLSVSRGSVAIGSDNAFGSLPGEVDQARSVPFFSYRMTGSQFGSGDFVRARYNPNMPGINFDTNRPQTGNFAYQSATFLGADVTAGQLTMTETESEATAIAPNVTAESSWLVYSYNVEEVPDGQPDPGHAMVRASVSSSSLDFTRQKSGSIVRIQYYLIQFRNGTTVTASSIVLGDGIANATTPSSQDPSTSVEYLDSFGRGGSSDPGGDASTCNGWVSTTLAQGDLRVERERTNGVAIINTNVIEFP